MATPKDLNPFAQETVYDRYDLPPFGTLSEISQQVKIAMADLDSLSDEERAERVADLQQSLNKIKNLRLRVLMNAHLLEEMDTRKVLEVLEKLPGPREEEIALPALGLSQIVLEGECPDYSKQDFRQIEPDGELLMDLQEVREHFESKPIERYIVFDS